MGESIRNAVFCSDHLSFWFFGEFLILLFGDPPTTYQRLGLCVGVILEATWINTASSRASTVEPSEYSRALEHVHSSMHVAVPFPEAADVSARSFEVSI